MRHLMYSKSERDKEQLHVGGSRISIHLIVCALRESVSPQPLQDTVRLLRQLMSLSWTSKK